MRHRVASLVAVTGAKCTTEFDLLETIFVIRSSAKNTTNEIHSVFDLIELQVWTTST